MFKGARVSAVIPALNEAPSIGRVVSELLALRHGRQALIDEVIVCDNGSTDDTTSLAIAAGARVVYEPVAGYGGACLRAIAALDRPDIVLFVDGDCSVNVAQVPHLLDPLDQGAELVVGSRTLGQAQAGSLTFPQRFGNRLATLLIRLIWQRRVSDLGPFRAIKAPTLERLEMRDQRFGWTIEMQIKAIQRGLTTVETPVDTRCRIGRSKISGTVKGTIGAGLGIIGMIIKLRRQELRSALNRKTATPITGFKS